MPSDKIQIIQNKGEYLELRTSEKGIIVVEAANDPRGHNRQIVEYVADQYDTTVCCPSFKSPFQPTPLH